MKFVQFYGISNIIHSYAINLQVSDGTQQQPQQGFFAITKSLIVRALIIYFVSSFLRRPSATNEENKKTNVQTASSNFFQNGTEFDLHVYISEDATTVNFSDVNSLVWFQNGLIYGDWNGGRNGDGTVVHHTRIGTTENIQVIFRSSLVISTLTSC